MSDVLIVILHTNILWFEEVTKSCPSPTKGVLYAVRILRSEQLIARWEVIFLLTPFRRLPYLYTLSLNGDYNQSVGNTAIPTLRTHGCDPLSTDVIYVGISICISNWFAFVILEHLSNRYAIELLQGNSRNTLILNCQPWLSNDKKHEFFSSQMGKLALPARVTINTLGWRWKRRPWVQRGGDDLEVNVLIPLWSNLWNLRFLV